MADRDKIIGMAVVLFRSFARGVAHKDVREGRMDEKTASGWVNYATEEFRKNLQELIE